MFETLQIGMKYSRPELASIWGYEGWRGFGKGAFTPKGRNLVILFVTRVKQKCLTPYEDGISGDTLYWQGELKGGSDQRIADASANGDEIHLFYREIHHTPFEYKGKVALLCPPVKRTSSPSEFMFKIVHDQTVIDDLVRFGGEIAPLDETEREQVVKSRLGQGRFRESLVEFWEGRCAVTELDHPSFLVASHIKPWRLSTNSERLNPANRLLLAAQYDKLFAKGLVTFASDGSIRISKAFPKPLWSRAGIAPDARLVRTTSEIRGFLDFHGERVFVHQTKD